jgi:hypothetical protein
MKKICLALLALCPLALSPAARQQPAPFPPLKSPGPVESYGRNIQRTMTLLATSTPARRNTVRILFYGQSITEQKWTQIVSDDLRRRFPHANLLIENRAIGGHSSPRLVKTAEADLYPFYPDLLIFHVYGAHAEYEQIIRNVRERTTAEILIQNDHLRATDTLDEETDPAKLGPRREIHSQFMNYKFLPETARKYGAELCDQRALWKQYLRDYNLEPKALLKDNVHLNAHGEYLMAEIVKLYLRHDPSVSDAAWKDLVKTYRVGQDVRWQGGKLKMNFEGNRVDVIAADGRAAPAAVRIDGHKPSAHPELYTFTRASPYPGSKWPTLLRVSSEKPLVVEDWTLTVNEISPDHKLVRFSVAGSQTGPDGEGTSAERFVSRSGRVVIEPSDWNLDYGLQVFKRPVAPGFKITWQVAAHFADEFISPGVKDAGVETVVTLAQGLKNGPHTLEISGGKRTPIAAVRVYRPPLAGVVKSEAGEASTK